MESDVSKGVATEEFDENDSSSSEQPAKEVKKPTVESGDSEEEESASPSFEEFLSEGQEEGASEEVSELTRLKQRNAELEKQFQERVAREERALLETPKPKVEEEDEDVDWRDPAIVSVFRQAFPSLSDQEVEALGPTLAVIAEKVVKAKFGRTLKSLETKTQEVDTVSKQTQLQAKLVSNLSKGVALAEAAGGVKAAVAKDAISNGRNSRLWKHLQKFPTKAVSVEGIEDAIRSVASEAQEEFERKYGGDVSEETAERVIRGPKSKVSAALGKASRAGIRKQQEPEKTPEQEIVEGIINAVPRRKSNLPAGLGGIK